MNGKHEPVIVGRTYILDADFATGGGEVEVVASGKYYCRVKDPQTGTEWDTMCYRLSEKKIIS